MNLLQVLNNMVHYIRKYLTTEYVVTRLYCIHHNMKSTRPVDVCHYDVVCKSSSNTKKFLNGKYGKVFKVGGTDLSIDSKAVPQA